jgi:hypothetical protein
LAAVRESWRSLATSQLTARPASWLPSSQDAQSLPLAEQALPLAEQSLPLAEQALAHSAEPHSPVSVRRMIGGGEEEAEQLTVSSSKRRRDPRWDHMVL